MQFVSLIYKITSNYPKNEIFGLTNQTRRASVSISANIAEGASRKSLVERKRFYEIARSSLVEVDNHIEIAKTLDYLNMESIKILEKILNELFAKLSKLLQNAK